jgi:hypothetical protein
MAQTGYTPILIYASGTTGNTPSASNLTSSSAGAELALNYFDGKLFYKDNTGTVQVLAGKGGTGVVAGSNTQVQFNNNGVFGASSGMTWNGTRLTVTDFADSSLTSGRVTFAGAGGNLSDASGLTWDGTNFTATQVRSSGLTSGRVTFAGASGLLQDSANLTFDGTSLTLAATSARILGDFTNATVTSRLSFQTTTANSTTGIYALPSGTSTAASWQATNASDPTNASKILIATNGSTDVQLVSGINGTGTYLPLSFYTNGAQKMQLDTSGNLGLGVTPSAWESAWKAFDYGALGSIAYGYGEVNFGNNFYRINTGAYKYKATGEASVYRQSAGVHTWNIAASGTAGNTITFTQAMTLDASGNLGIGTTSPASPLDVNSSASKVVDITSSNASGVYLRLKNTSTTLGYLGSAKSIYGTNLADLTLDVSGANNLIFGTNDTERARIDSSGNLGVGVISPGARLDVYSPSTTAGTPIAYFGKALNSTATSNVLVSFLINSGGTGSGNIVANGASQAAFASSSDSRLKENIVDLPPQLANIMALRPVEFDYIESEGGGHQIGFIAQEIESVYDDSVGERSDGMKMVSGWSKTEARLVKAIQELKATVDAQAARITALEQA